MEGHLQCNSSLSQLVDEIRDAFDISKALIFMYQAGFKQLNGKVFLTFLFS